MLASGWLKQSVGILLQWLPFTCPGYARKKDQIMETPFIWAVSKIPRASYITKNAVSRPQHAVLIASDLMLLCTRFPFVQTHPQSSM
ncbi:hypothetical protein HDV63DRAFT_372037 [Trichoderma sp. SZMC 28014]